MSKLMLSAQASGAQIETFFLPTYNHYSTMDVGQPLPLSVALRVTDIITELEHFPTNFTFRHYCFTTLTWNIVVVNARQ